ncbi:acetyl-CoA carboxylase carboxyltransferase subunit alpha/beta [Williamsia maris]|uniref:Acetyl-CoA carboxylase carboxyl transferase subunit beta n=1 Tax=Williamsia maris TaxID=72806 RepID=A0ABT1H9A2_9NOCA|nr:acetyl-CoA carboxylase carboxyltransferase subunit alpha/beta [Williamsia maris]MCP2174832.1 acetyl-CoA carboxylase carboxyl transferase subunit beta [Williamsia maris]
MTRRSAVEVRDLIVDPGSWVSWDEPITARPSDAGYADDLRAAREKTGLDESLMTGAATVRGHRVALVVSEFGFLAGSIGADAGTRMTAAIRRATAEGRALVALPASGGTRMQEGTAAFLQMVGITAAVVEHKAAHLPYLVYLRHPTTGGVFASWGSLGHVTLAEPGALIGFLGPRVYEGLYGEAFPEGVQQAENLRVQGLVDIVTPVDNLAEFVDAILRVHRAGIEPAEIDTATITSASETPTTAATTWDAVIASRREDRPGVRDLVRAVADDVVNLSGTGEGESDRGLLVAMVRLGGRGVVVIGQDRRLQKPGSLLGPSALRVARRGMQLAADLDIPLVTVIDTPGGELSKDAEEGGLAGEIARCLADLIALPVPTVSVLLGEGAGGAALALMPADRVVAAANAWLSPLPPEGASLIVHRDTDHAPEMAQGQGIGAAALFERGFVDVVVDEKPDAADEPESFCVRVGAAVVAALGEIERRDAAEVIRSRTERFGRP